MNILEQYNLLCDNHKIIEQTGPIALVTTSASSRLVFLGSFGWVLSRPDSPEPVSCCFYMVVAIIEKHLREWLLNRSWKVEVSPYGNWQIAKMYEDKGTPYDGRGWIYGPAEPESYIEALIAAVTEAMEEGV